MTIGPRAIIGGVGSVIGCCAVGTPLGIYSSQLISDQSSKEESPKVAPISIKKCESKETNSNAHIEFGDISSQNICWELASSDSGTELSTHEDKINSLLKTSWNLGTNTWSGANSSSWLAACVKGGWTLIQPGQGEYLGYCDQNNQQGASSELKTVFVHKQNENDKVKQIQLCFQDCWSDDSQSTGNIKTYQNTKNAGWKELKFRKSN